MKVLAAKWRKFIERKRQVADIWAWIPEWEKGPRWWLQNYRGLLVVRYEATNEWKTWRFGLGQEDRADGGAKIKRYLTKEVQEEHYKYPQDRHRTLPQI
jgi:hypothetical protein